MKVLLNQLTICLLLLVFSNPLSADVDTDIYSMDLEQLMNIKVISANKKSQSLLKTAAAIHVISNEDIRRSGATSLPEVLRGVPGLQVAQVDANKWAVSIRGFNSRLNNKLLVMVDGRSIYTPLFSGVFWNMHDMLLEDIDRIEIIRGPGGTLWGANAVNGVINILTKSADETQGTQVSFTAGSQEKILSARYGGVINEQTSYRLFAKGRHVENFNSTSQNQANDQWRNFTTGFRVDGNLNASEKWMLQGSYNVGTANQLAFSPTWIPPATSIANDQINNQNAHMLFRWNKQVAAHNQWRIQAYYDYFRRETQDATFQIHTIDLDIQNQLRIFEKHDVVWGLGYRGVFDELKPSFVFTFNPNRRYANTFNAFIQDEIQLTEAFRLTLGSKLEHNDFSGFEYQPNARIMWEINNRNSIWGAASRAVRIPARADSDLRINVSATPRTSIFTPPTLVSAFGNKNLNSEKVYAFELGYRSLLTNTFTLDTALFYNHYDDLVSNNVTIAGIEAQPAPPHLLIASTFDNIMKATTYGAEILAKWQVTDFWLLSSSYTWFKLNAHLKNNMADPTNEVFLKENSDPRHQFSVRSNVSLPYNLEFDSMFYYTNRLQAHNVTDQARLDLRLAWTPTPALVLSIVAQNILNKQHREFTTLEALNSEIPRNVFGRITLRF